MTKLPLNASRIVVSLGCAILLSGCAQPNPELMAAAASVETTPLFIEGALLNECLAGSDLARLPLAQPKAIYQPDVTYKFAYLTHMRGAPVIAKKMRIYAAELSGKNIFGSATTPKLLCIMALDGTQLSFVKSMSLDSDGRASYSERDGTIGRIVATELKRPLF